MSKVPNGLTLSILRERVEEAELDEEVPHWNKATRQELWDILEAGGITEADTVKAQIRREITMTGKGCDGQLCKVTVTRVGDGKVEFENSSNYRYKFSTTLENLKSLMDLLEMDA